MTNELIINRIFDAPPEEVWKAWTDPESVKHWWGPKEFTAPVSRIDLRVGGKYLYCMRSPDGQDFWSTGTYREIVPLHRIVATDSFADEKGNVVPASYYQMTGDWPLELLVTVTFQEQEGKTRLTLQHAGMPDSENRDLAKAGWNESLDKLAEYLAKN
ncbi:MAG TPA: SRPBCC domain-containing protein [Methanobacteriaceae archaeon]|nr:SRPBCC domain-containing protein [Methanobacteriaceae archaeon]